MNNHAENLTIKYLINLLNDHTDIKINRHTYLIDSYPTLKIDNIISYDNLLTALMIAYCDAQYKINESNLKIYVDENIIKNEKHKIQDKIYNSPMEQGKKKKMINFIVSQTNNNAIATNESILALTYYFGINLIIYNSKSQTIKCYYYENMMDREQPFIVIKETKDNNSPNLYYELVFTQNKFIFEFSHPIITELMPNAFIIGMEQNKKLEYLNTSLYEPNEHDKFESAKIGDDVVQLKLIPTHIIKLIEKLNTINFEKMMIEN